MSARVSARRQISRLALVAAAVTALLALTGDAWERDSSGPAVAASGAWRPLRDANLERTEVGAARIGRSIYVVGGFRAPSSTTAAVERYDIGRDRWRNLPPMPLAVNHPAVTSHGGFLYVYGGFTDNSFAPVTAALQRYDPRSRRWSLLSSSPTPRAAAALGARAGRLYAVGGVGPSGALPTLEVFHVGEGRWRQAPPMRFPREHIAAVFGRGGLYVLGGRFGAINLDEVERFDLVRGRWVRLPDLLHARSGIAAVSVAGRPVVFGGEELTPGGETIRPVELFDPGENRWRQLPGMRTPRHGLGGAALGRRIYAIEGGPTPGFDFSATLEFLDVPRGALR